MKRDQRQINGARRGFFRAVAGAGVAAGAGALILRSGSGTEEREVMAQASAPEQATYRETDHIRKYYDTARD